MNAKLMIDRHFLVLHGIDLAVFAERILRATQHHPTLEAPESLWQNLATSTTALRQVLDTHFRRSRARNLAFRSQEMGVYQALETLALHLEAAATCKYDLFTAGFSAISDKRAREAPHSRRMRRRYAAAERLVQAV